MLGPGEIATQKTLKILVWDRKSRVVAKLESLDCLEKCLGWKHQTISSSLQDLLDVVPTTKSLGEICGADIQWLQGEKERLENDSLLGSGCPKQKGCQNVWTAN